MTPPRAMILCAGRGERMRPLTDATPKPLLRAHGRPLVEWHLEALARAGVREVTINTAWLESQFPAALGDGSRFGLAIRYSPEGRDHGGALETAGGVAKALPGLVDRPQDAFWIVSGDIFMPEFRFDAVAAASFADGRALARLWLAPNPPHHPTGDFAIGAHGLARRAANGPRPSPPAAPAGGGELVADTRTRTWTGVGLFRAAMFDGVSPGTRLALRPLLEQAVDAGRLEAVAWDGEWADIGTPERLAALNRGGFSVFRRTPE